jgi:hypothetical protein
MIPLSVAHCTVKCSNCNSFCSALRQHVFNYLIWLSMQMMWKWFEKSKSLIQLFCNFDLKEMAARVQWTCKTCFNWTCSSLVQTIRNQKNGYILFFFFYFLIFFFYFPFFFSYFSFVFFYFLHFVYFVYLFQAKYRKNKCN